MDRTDATQYVTSGNKRRYNTSIPQTIIAPNQMSAIEEEITHVIEYGGLTPASSNWQQLRAAIINIIAAKCESDIVVPESPPAYVPPTVAEQFPSFEAVLTSDQTHGGAGAMTGLNAGVETIDTNNCYNTTTKIFVPKISGMYMFGAHIFAESTVPITWGYIGVRKNGGVGGQTMYAYLPGGFATNTRGGSFIGFFTVEAQTDYFQAIFSLYTNPGSVTCTVKKNGSYGYPISYWYGVRVG